MSGLGLGASSCCKLFGSQKFRKRPVADRSKVLCALLCCSCVCTLFVSGLGTRVESAKVPGPKVSHRADKMRKRPGAGMGLGLMLSSQNKRLEISLGLK